MTGEHSKAFLRKLWDFLGSRDLSVFIFVMAVTYIVILAIFATVISTPWVNRISTLLPFKVLYLIFFINLIICEIKWIPVILRRCRKPKLPEDLQRFGHRVVFSGQGSGVRRLEKYLRWRWYSIAKCEVRNTEYRVDGPESRIPNPELRESTDFPAPVLHAYRGRFSPLGSILFHAAFLFLLVGGWVSIFTSYDKSVMLMEGEASPLSPEDRLSISFRIEKITPAYWKERLLFTDLKADVIYPYKGEIRPGVIRLSQPLRVEGAKVTITGIGYAPMYLLKDKNGVELDTGYVKMNIFPSGNIDHFKIPDYPHQIFVTFYPDYEIRNGAIKNHSMNPVNPAYYIRVFRNKMLSYAGLIRPGEEAYYEGLRLSFPTFNYWGTFRITKNPGLVYIWIAFFLFVAGLTWSSLFYREEIIVIKEDDTLTLFGICQYYPRLFRDRLDRMAGGR